MGPKVKALVWEECRVAGVIAGACLLMGLFVLVTCKLSSGGMFRADPDSIFLFSVLATPMLTALLLILNPDNAGHLMGGFSMRVLRLPVQVSSAVAVALTARTLFVFVVTCLMVGASQSVFKDAPGWGTIFMITLFYVGAQVLDWLRAPLSGLSSLLLLLFTGTAFFLLLSEASVFDVLVIDSMGAAGLALVALVVALPVAYAVSVPAVHATRGGRCVGVPEIWAWPTMRTSTRSMRDRVFATPIAAQVWMEMRLAGRVLPMLTFVFWGVVVGAYWCYAGFEIDGDLEMAVFKRAAAHCIVGAFILAVLVQGVRMRILGYRHSNGVPGYQYLQPLSVAQFAYTRLLANAIMVLPTLAVVMVVHITLGGWGYLTDVMPTALALGGTSIREVVWTLLCRGIVAGIVCWALLAIGTRLFRRGIAFIVIVWILAGLSELFFYGNIVEAVVGPAVVLLFIALPVGAYLQALRHHLITLRTVAIAGFVWGLTTWLLYNAADFGPSLRYQVEPSAVDTFFVMLAFASLLILPYPAVLFDVRRRRHSATPVQDAAQHDYVRNACVPSRGRVLKRVAAGALVVFIVWLGSPVRPAYEALWRSWGYPLGLSELDASYPAVPDEENLALKYLAIGTELQRAMRRFEFANLSGQTLEAIDYLGSDEMPRRGPISARSLLVGERYWEEVVSQFAPALKELAADGPQASRYSFDLAFGYNIDHSNLTSSVRVLELDAIHWAVAGDAEKAVDSVLAILPLANSLADVPLIMPQHRRMSYLFEAFDSLEMVMNRCELSEGDLARLQAAFSTAIPPVSEGMMMDVGIIGESARYLNTDDVPISEYDKQFMPTRGLYYSMVLGSLLYPASAEGMLIVLSTRAQLDESTARLFDSWDSEDSEYSVEFFASSNWYWRWGDRGYLYRLEWHRRMAFGATEAGLAVARYRLAEGRLPTRLEELIPTYLAKIPLDYFDGMNPLRYRVRDDGEYVIYSVGRDRENNQGRERDRKNNYPSDITFTVAPVVNPSRD